MDLFYTCFYSFSFNFPNKENRKKELRAIKRKKLYNLERGYDPNVKNNGQIHAEMMCLINTKYLEVDWSKVSLYIYREHKDHTTALAKPCPACEKAIKERGIKQVYFTTEGIPYKKISYKK